MFDIKYAYVFQPFEILFNREDVSAALKEGIGLRMKKGREPLWIFYGGSGAQDLIVEFMPHLLPETEGEGINHFYQRMGSMASIQPFGWMEGCVLDGLMVTEMFMYFSSVLFISSAISFSFSLFSCSFTKTDFRLMIRAILVLFRLAAVPNPYLPDIYSQVLIRSIFNE